MERKVKHERKRKGDLKWGKWWTFVLQQTIIYMKIQRKVTQKGY